MMTAAISLQTFKDKLRFITQILAKNRSFLSIYLATVIVTSLIYAVLPYFLKLQLDQLENKYTTAFSFSASPLFIFIILLLIPLVLECIQRIFLDKLSHKYSILLNTKLRQHSERRVWDKINSLDAGFFQSKRNKKVFNDALGASGTVERAFTFLTRRFGGLLSFVTIIPLLALVSWQLVILVIVVSFLQLLVSKSLKLKNEGYSLTESRQNDQMWKIQDLLEEHFYEIKMMGNVDSMIEEYQKIKIENSALEIHRYQANVFLRSTSWFLDNFLIIITNIFIGYQVMFGDVSIGTFVLIVAYTQQINSFFHTAISSISDWQEIDFDLTKLGFFFALKSRIRTSDNPIQISESVESLELENVTFSYPDHSADEKEYLSFLSKRLQKWINSETSGYYRREILEIQQLLAEKNDPTLVLKNVSLKLEKGKIIALVGRNGSGKTTVTHLLQHHYEPTFGKALLDNHELFDYDQDNLLEQFSWLTQQPFILDRHSIKKNLLFGSENLKNNQAKMSQVISDLQLHTFIESLPKKLETVIDEDTSISGGQRQLLAIARTLIQQRPFIIFDEGSSQLDVEKEFLVLQQLQKAKQHAGILFITHRMSVARRADYIYVIDNGEIQEEGTHSELLKNSDGLYAHFWSLQMVE